MIKRKFGWANVEVPIIGQGTWMIESGGGIGHRNNNNKQLAIKTVQTGLELGMTILTPQRCMETEEQRNWLGKPFRQLSEKSCF